MNLEWLKLNMLPTPIIEESLDELQREAFEIQEWNSLEDFMNLAEINKRIDFILNFLNKK